MKFFRSLTIFIFSLLTFVSVVSAQSLNAVPTKNAIARGEQVAVRISVSSVAQSMNAVSATLSFPASLAVVAIDRSGSIIDFWTDEPHVVGSRIPFEGIALSPGYQGSSGTLFTVVFSGTKEDIAQLTFTNAAILANDGLGSNILKGLGTASIAISTKSAPIASLPGFSRSRALPVITEYSASVAPGEGMYVRGKGEPGEITKIVFQDASFKSIGEQFIASLQTRKRNLDEVLVKNSPEDGTFEYQSSTNLVAGAYNATPFLVDEEENIEKPGLGVQFFVNDSPIVRGLIVFVNILALLIPIVGLIVLIYFIPWYSFRRMRVIRRRLGLEEERMTLSSHNISREDKTLEHETEAVLSSSQKPPEVV